MGQSNSIKSNLEPQGRMAKLINTIHKTLATRGKHLIVRDFYRTPLEHELFLQALDDVPRDVWIYSKHVPNDFRLNYPMNPNIGKYGKRINVLEIEPSWPGGLFYLYGSNQKSTGKGHRRHNSEVDNF
jgi:hypothetical protein